MSGKYIQKIISFTAVLAAAGVFFNSGSLPAYVWAAASNGAGQESSAAEKPQEFPAHYEKRVSDWLNFDVEVDAGGLCGNETFQRAEARLAPVDLEKAYDCFMAGEEKAQPVVHENYASPEGERTPITVYEGEDFSFSASAYDFYLVKSPWQYVIQAFYPDKSTEEYNGDRYSTDSDLEFLSREDAWRQAVEYMEAAGVDMTDAASRVTYSLDMETLRQEETCVDVNGNVHEEGKNPVWSKEDEGYYYFITQYWEGIPLYDGFYINEDELAEGPLEIYQTREGVVSAALSRWFQIEPREGELCMAEFRTVMEALEEKYADASRTNPLTVERARLYLFPVKTEEKGVYTLEPVWVCTLSEYHEDLGETAYTSRFCVPIHAVTAEEMYAVEL